MSKRVRIGIIGGGRIGKIHAVNLSTRVAGVDVAGVSDPYADEEMAAWARDHGITRIIKDHTEFLNDDTVDAVLICSPTDTHASISREAAMAGKHVFCEKPLDQDPDVIREALEVVNKSGVVFQIGFNRRFDHNFRALRNAVEDGSLGDLHLLRITSRDPAPPPIEYLKVSGGLFMDMAVHDFDMARYLTGSEVVKVHAAGGVLVDPAIGVQGDIDTAVTTLWFENGAMGVIDNSRKAVYGYDQRAEIFGSKGAARIANDVPSTLVVSNLDGVKGENPLFLFLERYAESFAEEMRNFTRAINQGADVPGPRAALNSVLIATAAKESLKRGRPVDVTRS